MAGFTFVPDGDPRLAGGCRGKKSITNCEFSARPVWPIWLKKDALDMHLHQPLKRDWYPSDTFPFPKKLILLNHVKVSQRETKLTLICAITLKIQILLYECNKTTNWGSGWGQFPICQNRAQWESGWPHILNNIISGYMYSYVNWILKQVCFLQLFYLSAFSFPKLDF